jgi:hypothetical protein
MGEETDPRLQETSRQLDELLTSQEITYSNRQELLRYFRRQPPTSEDAVKVGDLFYQERPLYAKTLEPGSEEQDGCYCSCSNCMSLVKVWYELAIELDPHNPEPYERLARRISWELNEWPGDVLEPLRGDYDEATLRRVMQQYQTETAEWMESLSEIVKGIASPSSSPQEA